MNVLIYGAGNSIAISTAVYLSKAGHNPVLADTRRYVRGFYSRYCNKKYIFRNPCIDKPGFASDLRECIVNEEVQLILPTYDDALFHLIDAKEVIPEHVKITFPMDHEKARYVMSKENIPSICAMAGIDAIPTWPVNGKFKISDMEGIGPPYVLKLKYGVSGEGFVRVDSSHRLIEEIGRIKEMGLEDKYLVQEYIKGPVYGAGGVFENNELKRFFSYRYVRRHPPAGASTICMVDYRDDIMDVMGRVLKVLQWDGFCHMDFIVGEKSGTPYLTDINPVHWYTVPNSLSENYNCLDYYAGGKEPKHGKMEREGIYTTISISRELQRVFAGGIFRRPEIPDRVNYWRCLKGIRVSDFYWDPLPILLAPFLKLLRYLEGRSR